MRKKNIVLYAFMIVALTMVITPLVVAKTDTRLNGDVFIEYSGTEQFPDSPYTCSFVGTVEGDIEGDFYVTLIDVWFDPAGDKVEHFVEYWRIEPYSGGYIQGENLGKWTFSNFKWVANGEVTEASSEYQHLVGSQWQYRGTTTDPFDLSVPLVGYGKWQITHNK